MSQALLSLPPTALSEAEPLREPALLDESLDIDLSYDGGLIWSWDGGEVGLEGLFEVGAYLGDGGRSPNSEAYVKRMRPELFGSFEDGWRFRFEPKFDEDGVELEEAWAGRQLAGGSLLRVGRMKVPFGLEEVRSRRHIHFPRFSILNQFSPAEDHGLFWAGESGPWELGAAIYNGTGGSDEDDGKDVALRAMYRNNLDVAPGDERWEAGLGLTFGDQQRDVGGDLIKNAAGLGVVELAPGSMLDGARTRLGLEAAWFGGPWMIQAELLAVEQEMDAGGGSTDVGFQGFYVDLARVISGESIDFGGVESPNDSWVGALRLSSLELDDELAALAVPGTFTEAIHSVSIGLNWVPNSHVIVRHAYVHSFYDGDVLIDGDSLDDEGLLTFELQLHF